MERAVKFWKSLLNVEPHKKFEAWHEFVLGNIRLGLLLSGSEDKFSGSNCVPVFEFDDKDLPKYIEKAKKLGAKVVVDGLKDPNLKSIVFKDPFGNEFEFSKFHD